MLRDPRRYQKRTKRPAGEGWRGARSEGVGAEKGGGERANEGEAAGKMGRRRRVRKELPRSTEEWERQGGKERPRETEKETRLSIQIEKMKERGKD